MAAGDKAGRTGVPAEPTETEIKQALEARGARRIDPEDFKIAAVLIPIFQMDGHWRVLLTRRSQNVEHHKGEISFPGGHRDPEDPDLLHTALREAEEEVGIPPTEVLVLGRLDDIITITGFRIRPFVGRIPYPFEINPSDDEISEVIVLPLFRFFEPDIFTRREFTRAGEIYPVYYFRIDEYNVWGATAKMLKQFLEIAMGYREPGAKEV